MIKPRASLLDLYLKLEDLEGRGIFLVLLLSQRLMTLLALLRGISGMLTPR